MDIQGLIRSTLITRFWFIFLFFLSIELILEYLLYLGILFLGCIFLVREQIFLTGELWFYHLGDGLDAWLV